MVKSKGTSCMGKPKRGELPLRQKYKKQKVNFLSSPCYVHLQNKLIKIITTIIITRNVERCNSRDDLVNFSFILKVSVFSEA